jgi:hypothetical protein
VKGFALEINVLEGSQLLHVLVAEEPRYGFLDVYSMAPKFCRKMVLRLTSTLRLVTRLASDRRSWERFMLGYFMRADRDNSNK